MHPVFPTFLVFVGCCSNVVLLELLVRSSPTCGTMVTFMQFLFISVEGFINTTRFGTKKPVIPLKSYLVMVGLFFLTSIVNNYAFAFNVSIPLHLIFRSGSLMANLVLGCFILKKSYTPTKCFSVAMITVGIFLATIASVDEKGGERGQQDSNDWSHFIRWLFGIFILTVALFLSALMGLYQETVYKRHGKHPSEALFYNHALPLPFFLLFYKDLLHHFYEFNKSEPLMINIFPIPIMWVFIIGNMITQYLCIRSVFVLTTECPSLTVTLVVTLRKFISLIFSIFYFGNPFTPQHWLGAVLVFGGTLLFADIHNNLVEHFSKRDLGQGGEEYLEVTSRKKLKSQ